MDSRAALIPSSREPVPRALVRFAGMVVFSETAFFSVLVPLLPRLSHLLSLTQAEAGLLVAAYPAGILLTVMPAIWLAGRLGARTTARAGLAFLAVASLEFGVAGSALLVDATRFVQGAGACAAWAGTLIWI